MKGYIPNRIKKKVALYSKNFIDTFKYYFLEDSINEYKQPVKHIVFVCKGNICRSPLAEYDLKRLSPYHNCRIESCGLDVDQGKYPPPEAVQAARRFGVDLSKHISKGIMNCRIDGADLILAMEYNQYKRLQKMFPLQKSRIKLIREYAPFPYKLLCNIDDPFGCKESEYDKCYYMLDKILKIMIRKNRS
jgi:protein-tyrosine phosphatase